MMTGVKIALNVLGLLGSGSAVITGGIIANVPAISPETPVSITMGLISGGLVGSAVLGWKVAGAWYAQNARIKALEDELTRLRNSPPSH